VFCCRVYDPTSWSEHTKQPEGCFATRVDLSNVLDHHYYALFCSRSQIYLCTKDNLAFIKNLFGDNQPGALLVRGYNTAADNQVQLSRSPCRLKHLCTQPGAALPLATPVRL
jgi:hypothetical protein